MSALAPRHGGFPGAAAQLVVDAAAELGCDNVCLHLRSSDGERLICQAISSGYRATHLAFGLDLSHCPGARDAIDRQEIVTVDTAADDERVAKIARERFGLGACLYVPFQLGDRRGVLIPSYRQAHHWSEHEIETAQRWGAAVAEQLAECGGDAPAPLLDLSSENLSAILDALPGLVFIVDPTFSVVACNRRFLLERPGLRSTTLADLLRSPDRGDDLRRILADVLNGDLTESELLLRTTDGAEWRIDIAALHGSGPGAAPAAMTVCCTDVTDTLAAHNLRTEQRHFEALGRISASVSHEFRNILQVVDAYLEMSSTGPGSESDRIAAHTATQRGVRLARQLLTFARPEEHRPHTIDLGRLVEDQRTLLHSAAGSRREFLVTTAPAPVIADPDDLELALINLVINARDATATGGRIEVSVTNEDSTRDGHRVTLTVRDNGCGMSPEIAARAAEPFFSTKPHGQGTGLGLATVQKIAATLGGEMEIESQLGVGTEVRLRLPRADSAAKQAPAATPQPTTDTGASPTGGSTAATGLSVLVVEDEDLVSRWVQRLLERNGHTAQIADSGSAALQRLRSDPPPRVVLLDMALPDQSGMEVWRAVQDLELGCRWIACTGFAENEELRPMLDAGVELLRKPYTGKDLLQLLQQTETR